MKPLIFGYASWYVLWTAAGLVGSAVNFAALRRLGVPAARAALLLGVLPLLAVLGAKLFYVIENGLSVTAPWHHSGYRMPGGLLAFALGFVTLCRGLRIPVLGALDAIAPGVALVIAVGRIGCFLKGCCFGTVTELPWAVVFPSGSPAHTSHQAQQLLSPDAAGSLAVHPLSLYFSLDALAIAVFVLWLARRARYPGQVFLWFVVLRTWSKAALESVRGDHVASGPNHSGEAELWVALASSAALIAVTGIRAARTRQARRSGAVSPAERAPWRAG